MRTLFLFIIAVYTIGIYGCTDNYTRRCKDFLNNESKSGYSFAKGSYKDFGEFGNFRYTIIEDSAKLINKVILGFSLLEKDELCFNKVLIGINNIPLQTNDTIFLKYSFHGFSSEYETASYYILDDDALYEQYDLLEGESVSNWLIIESINVDTSIIEGKFNLSFVTTNIKYLTGEKERWDDPNRPDTLHFTNGEFKAVLSQ
jgi:hypothetical protein